MRILVAHSHTLIRQGLRTLLPQLGDAEPAQVLEAASDEEALAQVRAHLDLSLVVLDLRLPGAGAFATLAKVRQRRPDVPVVVMAREAHPLFVRKAFGHGANGFIVKSSTPQVIVAALRLVLSGGEYVPPEIVSPGTAATRRRAARADSQVVLGALGITARQSQVLTLLLAGKSNKAISRELDLAHGTVKNHVAALLRALDVDNRVQAVIAAARLGLK